MARYVKYKLVNYDGGLPDHPQPEESGAFVLPASPLDRWELRWDRKDEAQHGELGRFSFIAEPTGSKSCRVTVADAEDASVAASFELPKTPAPEFTSDIEERITAHVAAGERQERVDAGAWWLAPDAFKSLGWSKSVTVKDTHYLGGWSGHTKTYTGKMTKMLAVDAHGVSLKGFKTLFTIPWSDIADMIVEGPDQASKRVTVSRLLLVGVFAFAAKKKTKFAVLIVRTHDGEEAVFQTEDLVAPQLQAKLYALISQVRRVNPPVADSAPRESAPASIADEIKKLGDLRDAGLLTDEEFSAQKAKLLGA